MKKCKACFMAVADHLKYSLFSCQSPHAGLTVQIDSSIPSRPPGRLLWTTHMMWRNLFLNSSISQSFWKIKIVRNKEIKNFDSIGPSEGSWKILFRTFLWYSIDYLRFILSVCYSMIWFDWDPDIVLLFQGSAVVNHDKWVKFELVREFIRVQYFLENKNGHMLFQPFS